MWSIRDRASNFSWQFSFQSVVYSVLFSSSSSSSSFFFFFFFFLSLVLLFSFIAIFSCRSVLSFLSVSVVAVCYGCSILLRILVAYLLIYRYTDTDPQILSVSSFVSNICQLQILQLILAPSWCSSTGDTFPSYHQSSVAFSLCRGLPLSSTSGDAVGRVID